MTTRISINSFIVAIAVLLVACGGGSAEDEEKRGAKPARKANEPDYISIEYLRVGFAGLPGDQEITRSHEEAKARAEDALRRAKAGEDFAALVKELSDDEPRAYQLANTDATPKAGYFMRAGVVPVLGDVGFGLEKGGVGLAPFDGRRSPYGFYVIKRTE